MTLPTVVLTATGTSGSDPASGITLGLAAIRNTARAGDVLIVLANLRSTAGSTMSMTGYSAPLVFNRGTGTSSPHAYFTRTLTAADVGTGGTLPMGISGSPSSTTATLVWAAALLRGAKEPVAANFGTNRTATGTTFTCFDQTTTVADSLLLTMMSGALGGSTTQSFSAVSNRTLEASISQIARATACSAAVLSWPKATPAAASSAQDGSITITPSSLWAWNDIVIEPVPAAVAALAVAASPAASTNALLQAALPSAVTPVASSMPTSVGPFLLASTPTAGSVARSAGAQPIGLGTSLAAVPVSGAPAGQQVTPGALALLATSAVMPISILPSAEAALVAAGRDIMLTGSLGPARWSAALTSRPRPVATAGPRRWTANLRSSP